MLLASRRCFYALTAPCRYATSTAQTQLQATQINKVLSSVSVISTLLPEKLVHSDFLVLAGREHSWFRTQLSLREPAKNHGQAITLSYQAYMPREVVVNEIKGRVMYLPFPRYAQGFLYLHQPRPDSDLPRSASAIRLRCVPSLADASSSYVASVGKSKSRTEPLVFLPPSIMNQEICEAFKDGYDLNLPNGLPWSISVVAASAHPSLVHIRLQLLEEDLFSESELREYEDIYKNTNNKQRSKFFYIPSDVFPVRFDSTSFSVWSKEKETRRLPLLLHFKEIFMDPRLKYGKVYPYTGAALARFELAPDNNLNKPALSLRFTKLIEPVECVIPDYDGYISMPKAGKLYRCRDPHTESDKPKSWIYQLDPTIPQYSALLSLVSGYETGAKVY